MYDHVVVVVCLLPMFERFVNGDISRPMSTNVFVKSFYSSVREIDWLTVGPLTSGVERSENEEI